LVYGGAAGGEINLDFPEDETRLSELELIYEKKYSKYSEDDLKAEARDLVRRYDEEIIQAQINDLVAELEEQEGDEQKTNEILRKIQNLRNQIR
jgi:hypothetical protein